MKKELKDYAPFYLGCEVIGTYNGKPREGYLTGVNNGGYDCEIQFFEEDGINVFEQPEFNTIDKIKLVLRPLSDMTEEEANEAAAFALGNEDFIITYKGMGYDENGIGIHKTVKCYQLETFCELPTINNWLPTGLFQVDHECNDIIFSRFEDQGKVLSDDMIEKPFELTKYLLSKHFDIFGLIKSGLAIDKTKI